MDIYRDEILDHAKNPRNWGRLEKSTHRTKFPNPLCGDTVELFLNFKGQPPKVSEVKFETNGCVVSVAASSMLTEKIKGRTAGELGKITDEELLSWFGETLTSSRRDCALLPLKALREILRD